ncbi:MAG: hypothetical protein CMB96_05495, partial [Flavobacteriaceae bacterium]|nr:hypothetical protein [Flavobacteriaceae bacterium]
MLRQFLTLFAYTLLFTFLTRCEKNTNMIEEISDVEVMKSSTGAEYFDLKKIPLQKINTQALKVIEDWTAL